MHLNLVSLQIHLRPKDDKLLLETFSIHTWKVVFSEMSLERIIVLIVLWPIRRISGIADMTPLMLFPAMREKFVFAIKSLATEATLGMPREARLVYRTRIVVAKFLVFAQGVLGEELVFVSEDLFIASAQVTHGLVMRSFDMAVQVWPAETSDVAVSIWAIVAQ